MKRAIVIYHLILFWGITLSAKDLSVYRDTLYTQIKFQQEFSTIDTQLGDNKEKLNQLIPLLNNRASDSNIVVKSIFSDLSNDRLRATCELKTLHEAPTKLDTGEDVTVVASDNTPVTECQDLNSVDVNSVDVVPAVEEGIEVEKDKKRAILLKTNMLYDALAVPNIGLEVSLNTVWSLGVNWMYAWWSNDTKHHFIRTYGGDVELRRWILPNRKSRTLMCGHHIGIYGQLLTYDVEWGGIGYLGDRWSWAVGLSYGYSLPIGKQFNIDFTFGVGYMRGDYMKYRPKDDCYVWDSTHNRKWFGPTKAEVSLVWYMGGRYTKKGGKR